MEGIGHSGNGKVLPEHLGKVGDTEIILVSLIRMDNPIPADAAVGSHCGFTGYC